MSVTTGKVRLSYCHIWEPYAQDPKDDPKYSVTILIPKTDTATLNAIQAEMMAAEQQGVTSKWGGVRPPVVKNPLYDGDGVRPSGEPFGEECRGHMVMTASNKDQPSVVDLQVAPIMNRSEVYSGCYARVSLNFFAYAASGNKGIGCWLNGIQKIEDGEPLSGHVSAQEAFGGANAYAGPAGPAAPQYGIPAAPSQYSAPVQPSYTQPQYSAPVQPGYPQQPGYVPPQYSAPAQQPGQISIDPITGQPGLTGGILGIVG